MIIKIIIVLGVLSIVGVYIALGAGIGGGLGEGAISTAIKSLLGVF